MSQIFNRDFDEVLHFDEDLPVELSNTNLLDLNDDCLREILSMNLITVIDLCSTARTSVRLRDIANDVFQRKYKICDIWSLVGTTSEEIRTIVTFGSFITELRVSGVSGWIQTRLFDTVTRYCTNSLRSLHLDGFITDYMASELDLIFKNLDRLDIRCGSLFTVLDYVRSPVEFYLSGTPSFLLQGTFSKLERLVYLEYAKHIADSIKRYENLKGIKIESGCNTADTLLMFANNCSRLEELQFVLDDAGVLVKFLPSTLPPFKHLRKLQIDCARLNVVKIVKKLKCLNSLEHLELMKAYSSDKDNNFMLALSQLNGLHVLKLIHCYRLQYLNLLGDLHQLRTLSIISYKTVDIVIDLVAVIKRLDNLTTLELEGGKLTLDQELYSRIVEVVRSRSQQTLTIAYYRIDDADANLQIDEADRKIVDIKCSLLNYLGYPGLNRK